MDAEHLPAENIALQKQNGISSKYQIVITKAVRQRLGLKPGQSLQVTERDNHIELRPILAPNQLIGILADCRHIPLEREKDRELP